MNRIFKTTILSAAVAAMTLAALPAANASDWRHRHNHRSGDAVAAGVLGLAAGALIGGALANPGPAYDDGYYGDDYYEQRRYVRVRPRVIYRSDYAGEPWTREWVRYCSNRYRSFDARSGTFVGYDGQEHFCTAN
ncbi:BA14K family protein [Mesorhizobium sp. A556]